MSNIVRILGSAVFTAAMYCVPILLACSFCLDWNKYMKLLLCFCAFIQFVVVFAFVATKAEEGET